MIEPGREWGTPGQLAPDAPIARSDAEAARLMGSPNAFGVESGDLARTLGARSPYHRSGPKQFLPIDAIRVQLDDGRSLVAVASITAGHRYLRGEFVALMNAAFLGDRNIAPRAHPGDGKVDLVRLNLDPADRFKAWRRMRTAAHVPHSGIKIRQRTADVVQFERRVPIVVDGVSVGRSRSLDFVVLPAAFTVAV